MNNEQRGRRYRPVRHYASKRDCHKAVVGFMHSVERTLGQLLMLLPPLGLAVRRSVAAELVPLHVHNLPRSFISWFTLRRNTPRQNEGQRHVRSEIPLSFPWIPYSKECNFDTSPATSHTRIESMSLQILRRYMDSPDRIMSHRHQEVKAAQTAATCPPPTDAESLIRNAADVCLLI